MRLSSGGSSIRADEAESQLYIAASQQMLIFINSSFTTTDVLNPGEIIITTFKWPTIKKKNAVWKI